MSSEKAFKASVLPGSLSMHMPSTYCRPVVTRRYHAFACPLVSVLGQDRRQSVNTCSNVVIHLVSTCYVWLRVSCLLISNACMQVVFSSARTLADITDEKQLPWDYLAVLISLFLCMVRAGPNESINLCV